MQENGPTFLIQVPSFRKKDDHVYYEIHVQDLKSDCLFSAEFRYSELKKLHESLETLKTKLPQFPSTSWWKSTNSNPELIEERRENLDNYFKQVLSIKLVRESLIMKNFILEAQKDYDKKVQKEKNKQKQQEKKQEKGQIKNHSKFNTPACQPVQEPIKDTRERSQSFEEQQQQQPPTKSNPGSRKGSAQLQQLNFGGTKIFRGILSNAKQTK